MTRDEARTALKEFQAEGVVVVDGAFGAGSIDCFHGVDLVIAIVDLMAVQLFLFLVNLDISVV